MKIYSAQTSPGCSPSRPTSPVPIGCPGANCWRVFAIDVTECPDCGGRMRIVAALTDPASIRSYLEGVGLSARPPPIAPARTAQQSQFEYAA